MDSKEIQETEETADVALAMGEPIHEFVRLKDGTKVTIIKCRTKHVGLVMEFLAFIMKEMNVETFGDMPDRMDFNNPTVLLPILTRATGRVMNLCAELCSLTLEEVEELELDDTIALVTQEYKVNADFFLKNVMPSLPRGILEVSPAVTSAES